MAVLICVCGPSQAGKNTLIAHFIKEHPKSVRVPTATSRPPRAGEQHGVDKFFVKADYFETHKEDFLESVIEHGNHYGVMLSPLQKALQNNDYVFMDIDIRGAHSVLESAQLRETNNLKKIIAIFVCPSSFEHIVQRIKAKGDKNADARIESAKNEWLHRTDPFFSASINTSLSVEESYALFKQAIETSTKKPR